MSFKRKSKLGGLLLTRKPGDYIYINHGELIIEVVEIVGRYVRLAFKANRTDISIKRGEFFKSESLVETR
jgi:sRNA-binding carbon storage regulator CsrA